MSADRLRQFRVVKLMHNHAPVAKLLVFHQPNTLFAAGASVSNGFAGSGAPEGCGTQTIHAKRVHTAE